MRFRHVLLLVLAVLPAIPAFADETVDESQAILAIGRLGARIELDEKLPGHPVVGINLRGCHRFKNKDCHLLQPFRHLRSLDLTERKITDAGLKEIRELNEPDDALPQPQSNHGCRPERAAGAEQADEARIDRQRDHGCRARGTAGAQGPGLARSGPHANHGRWIEAASRPEPPVHVRPVLEQGHRRRLERAGDLQELADLEINDTGVTGSGLKELRNLKKLTKLDLLRDTVTDEGLKDIRDLEGLTELNLGDTQVTDAGLKELASLTRLSSAQSSRAAESPASAWHRSGNSRTSRKLRLI